MYKHISYTFFKKKNKKTLKVQKTKYKNVLHKSRGESEKGASLLIYT